jgi:phosphoglycolate phosphatase
VLPLQIIFDLDDTLIESFSGYSRVHRLTARALGLPELSLDELVPYDVDFTRTLCRQYGHLAGFDAERFVAEWDRIADDHPYRAIDGVIDALERLRARGAELWIVTSRSRRRLAQRMLEGGLSFDWFRGVFPREQQPQQKPHPGCFEPVWEQLGVRPGASGLRVLFVGDREGDRRAAVAAEVPFLAVRTGPEVRLGFPRGVADEHVLDTAALLPDWLEHNGY